MTEDTDESLTYVSAKPDIKVLADAYTEASDNLSDYFQTCETSYDDRRNLWAGKTDDLRKGGATAFPWVGASDQEVNVVGERLDTYVSLFDQALQRSHIKAFPTSVATMARAAVVSVFLKWMRSTYIPDFKGQMELGGNYLLEKGLMISYVGWKRESRTYLQSMTLDEMVAAMPELEEIIADPANDEDLAAFLTQAMPAITENRAKKAIKQLRETGAAEIPIPRMSVDCPIVHSCAPDGEVIMPSYVTDPQRSPYIFWKTFLTPQELEKKVTAEGWDRKWVDHAIANLKGVDSNKATDRNTTRRLTMDDDQIMVIYGHQRLIDEEDGSEGIYRTVFHPDVTDSFAHHELMNGYDDYPFVFTRLSRDQARFYESQPMTKSLRGPQMQIKTEVDSRVDRASISTLPELMHPAGRAPTDRGPGRMIPYRRLGELAYLPIPQYDRGSPEIEGTMRMQADRAVGLDMDNPLAMARQQFYVSKFLDHVRDCLAMALKLYQRLGPDEVFFQVTGIADPQTMTKGDPDENYSIVVAFDSMSTDPETAELRAKQMGSLVQFDRNGRIDMDKFLEFTAMSIDPVLADYILQPKEVAQEKMAKDVTDDLTKISAAIEVPARPNGAAMALQIIQGYAQQPDVAARLQQDEAFAERLSKYAEQYSFQMQQAQNAQIGRIGTAPAEMGGVNTQQMDT
jgi:hypothetical protein